MKRYIPSILAVLSLITAMSITSCSKVEPIIENPQKGNTTPEKGSSEEDEKTDPAEELLLLVAQNGYTVYEYTEVASGHRFTFHEPKVIASIKDEYPEGVRELTVPTGIVTKVEETVTKYTIFLKSGKTASLNRYAEFRTTLAAHKDTTVYKGVAFEVPFEVTASNGKTLTVSNEQASGADIEVSLKDASGTITVTPNADNGTAKIILSNGLLEIETEISFETFYLNVSGIPESFGDGNEYSFELGLDTNLPEEEILVDASDTWIETELQDARIAVRIGANGTNDNRTGKIAVKEAKGLIVPVSVEIRQDNILINKEGMVQFKDRAFKNACLEIADANHDGDISPEEALSVKELLISGKRIKNLDGIESFRNLQKLDASNNNITEVDFSDPGSFANLKDINLKRNQNLKSGINVSGCYTGMNSYNGHLELIKLDYDINEKGVVVYDAPSYYSSVDFSQEGARLIYEHTKGKGISIVFIITEYLDVDYISGAVHEIVNYAVDNLFSTEPFKSMKGYFDIYEYAIIAPNTQEKGTINQAYNDFIESLYGFKLFDSPRLITEVNLNSGVERANAFAYRDSYIKTRINLRDTRTPNSEFKLLHSYTITHEFGHAIGGLADQYEEERQHNDAPNFTTNKENIPWSKFLKQGKYQNKISLTYNEINKGYYPSDNSIMGTPLKSNYEYFDSPSRFAIYSNIIWRSQTKQEYSWPDNERIWDNYSEEQLWQDFLEYDKINDNLPI